MDVIIKTKAEIASIKRMAKRKGKEEAIRKFKASPPDSTAIDYDKYFEENADWACILSDGVKYIDKEEAIKLLKSCADL